MSSPKGSPLPDTTMDALLLGRLDELTVNEPGNRGRGILSIILSIIVLLLISSMIVAAIVIINPDIANFTSKQNKVREAITLEEVLQGELSPRDFSSHWLPGDQANNIADQLLYEDTKSLNLVTLPSVLKPKIDIISSQTENGQTLLPPAPPQPSTDGAPESAEQFNFQHQNTFRPDISVLVSNSSLLSSIDYQGFKLSPSKRYLLIWTAKKKQFRHSSTAKYFLYDIKLDLISLISTKPVDELATGSYSDQTVRAQPSHNRYETLDTASLYLSDPTSNANDDSYARFQIVDWFSVKSNPNTNGESTDSLVLIQNNDIYTLNNVAELSSSLAETNSNSNSARPSRPIRLTFTGKAGEIFNGISDWLYEEEILSDSVAFKVSPSAKYLAYMSFNDSQVNLMPFSTYGERIIPRVQQIRYPKAGQPNPLVNVHVIENFGSISSQNDPTSASKDVKLDLPANLRGQQHYINRINWLSREKLSLTWSSRNQNESFVIICSKNNSPLGEWRCVENLHIQSKDGWLDIGDNTHPLDDDHYLATLPKYEGNDVGYFTHLAKVSMNKANNFVYLTGGRKEVTSINGIDHNNSLIYYTSTVVDEPGQRQMFVANFDKPAARQLFQRTQPVGTSLEVESTIASVCVTCSHHPGSCLYNNVKLSPSTKYYILRCEGPDVPRFELYTTMQRQSSRNVVADHLSSPPLATKSISMPDGRAKYEQLGQAAAAPRHTQDDSLLWVIEDNIDLRNKLEYGKAMPLTVRLKVPIQNTTHFANVLLLLPPPMGPTTTFRATSSLAAAQGRSNIGPPVRAARPRRDINGQLPQVQALPPVLVNNRGNQGQRRENLFANLDMEAIKEYTSQLPAGQQYPMVVDVYGGPGSQKVDYGYSVYFGHYMASNRRTVYAMIDGRGSGYQGSKRLYELYHKFGTVEIQDQIDTTAYLTRVLPFVDPTKVAIWGWSYGGYAAAMALAQSNARALEAIQAHLSSLKGQHDLLATTSSPLELSAGHSAGHLASKAEAIATRTRISSSTPPLIGPAFRGVFECAASVAPVTNWIYYDTAYTEKFMSSPWLNEQYDEHNTRDHLTSRSSTGLFPLSQNYQQQQHSMIAANRWTHLNSSAISSLNDPVRRSSPSSQLLELIAKSAQIAASTNSTIQRVVSNFIQNGAGQLRSPFYDELNERYKKASLLDQIGNIDRKRFLLIHGTADDNVHFQNSIMLMKQLIRKNILFESRLYPDQDHGIANKADKLHLATTLSNFFAECFDMAY